MLYRRILKPGTEAKVIRYYVKHKDANCYSTAIKFDLANSTVYRMLKRNGVPIRKRGSTWSCDPIPKDISKRDGSIYHHRKRTRETLLKKQNYKCAICPSDLLEATAHVDHCHATGRIRGALCSQCNHGLGNFKDDAANLRAAIKYLKQHRM